MMETTVTMSLERYKELESKEEAFHKMSREEEKCVWAKGYGYSFLILTSDEANVKLGEQLNQARTDRDTTISKVRDYEKRTGKKVFEL